MKRFISADREQAMFMPYDVNSWLPESHLARFVVEIVDKLNFSHVYNQYKGTGSTPYEPKLLLSLLFYGYSTGVFSSRKIEGATYDSVAFRFISGNHHPDHDTLSSFRKRFLPEIKDWFKEILLIGKELGLIKLGNIYIDGTMVQANASRHKAMSYEYIKKLEKQLKEEIGKLLDLANKQDEQEKNIDLDIPEEIKHRADRLQKIKEAKRVVEERSTERYKKEKADYDQMVQKRKEIEQCQDRKINPIISVAREKHNSYLENILNPEIEKTTQNTPLEHIKQTLKSEKGSLIYKKTKANSRTCFWNYQRNFRIQTLLLTR